MRIDDLTIRDDIGLKVDALVVLGKEAVSAYLLEHAELFEDLDVKSLHGSTMLYGQTGKGHHIKLGLTDEGLQRIVLVTKSLDYRRYKAIMSYDGHQYNGFQIQKDQPSIQGELTKAISSINGKQTLVQGASRTDTGVHAYHYVFHFDSHQNISDERWLELINHQLPNDMHVQKVHQTHPLFHSRYDVLKKRYVYKIKLNEADPFRYNYEWYVKSLDIEVLKANIKQVIGRHNFTSFCKGAPDSPYRTVYDAHVRVEGNLLELWFEADGFLRYMIRILVRSLVDIATGKHDFSIDELINQKSRQHTKHLAPARGLYLAEIIY